MTLDKIGKPQEADEVYIQAVEIEKRKADPETAIRQMIDLNPDIPEP